MTSKVVSDTSRVTFATPSPYRMLALPWLRELGTAAGAPIPRWLLHAKQAAADAFVYPVSQWFGSLGLSFPQKRGHTCQLGPILFPTIVRA